MFGRKRKTESKENSTPQRAKFEAPVFKTLDEAIVRGSVFDLYVDEIEHMPVLVESVDGEGEYKVVDYTPLRDFVVPFKSCEKLATTMYALRIHELGVKYRMAYNEFKTSLLAHGGGSTYIKHMDEREIKSFMNYVKSFSGVRPLMSRNDDQNINGVIQGITISAMNESPCLISVDYMRFQKGYPDTVEAPDPEDFQWIPMDWNEDTFGIHIPKNEKGEAVYSGAVLAGSAENFQALMSQDALRSMSLCADTHINIYTNGDAAMLRKGIVRYNINGRIYELFNEKGEPTPDYILRVKRIPNVETSFLIKDFSEVIMRNIKSDGTLSDDISNKREALAAKLASASQTRGFWTEFETDPKLKYKDKDKGASGLGY